MNSYRDEMQDASSAQLIYKRTITMPHKTLTALIEEWFEKAYPELSIFNRTLEFYDMDQLEAVFNISVNRELTDEELVLLDVVSTVKQEINKT